MRHPGIYDNPIGYTRVVKDYVGSQAKVFNRTHQMPGSAGFVINSFLTSGFDKETGEIFKDTWDADAEVEGMRRALNYRQCYISRMPQEDTGAFWKATIYSPRNPKMGPKLALAVKRGLDPKQFGGFSSQQFAYFFIYEAKKKGKPCFQFAEVPVWLAERINARPEALVEYASGLAEGAGLDFVRVVRSKIYKKQLIELDGERFFITGKKEMRNAVEAAFSTSQLALLEGGVADCSFTDVLDILRAVQSAASSRLLRQIKMDDLITNGDKLSGEESLELAKRILLLVNGTSNMVDLSAADGSKFSGCIQPNYSKLLNDPKTNFYIIDQSVTGMFERRTRVGL